MFWKVFELLVRLVYFKRFRQAERIQKAAELAGEGKTAEALNLMDEIEAKLEPSIASIYWLTRGRIHLSERSLEKAEAAFICSAKADPANAKAHLDLAVVSGRRFKFDDARARLEKIKADAGDEEKKQAGEILELLDQVISGEREREFEQRAQAMAGKPIGQNGETAGLPADLRLLDGWISRKPEEARKQADEIALLLGRSAVSQRGARWKVSLAIEDSLVVLPDGTELSPFEIVSDRFSSSDATLETLFDKKAKVVKNP